MRQGDDMPGAQPQQRHHMKGPHPQPIFNGKKLWGSPMNHLVGNRLSIWTWFMLSNIAELGVVVSSKLWLVIAAAAQIVEKMLVT